MIICKRPAPLGDNLQPRKGREKCIFETLQNDLKRVLSIKESNFNGKMGQNLHICLRSGPVKVDWFVFSGFD